MNSKFPLTLCHSKPYETAFPNDTPLVEPNAADNRCTPRHPKLYAAVSANDTFPEDSNASGIRRERALSRSAGTRNFAPPEENGTAVKGKKFPAQNTLFIRVLINTPAQGGLFDYSVPEDITDRIRPGQMVTVPFNNTTRRGIIWERDIESVQPAIREIHSLTDPVPVLTEAQMRLAEKIAERSLSSLAEAAGMLLTPQLRGAVSIRYRLLDPAEDSGKQCFLPGAEPAVSLTALLKNHEGVLNESALNRLRGKQGWQREMRELIRAGKVCREADFETETPREKKEAVVMLAPDAPDPETQKFSPYSAVNERRRACLRTLRERGGRMPKALLISLCDLKREDLKVLAASGAITLGEQTVFRDHRYSMADPVSEPPALTAEQQTAVEEITRSLREETDKEPILLHGVTGSGKTEVYLRAAAETLRLGKQVLLLLPEIALTPQILARFEARFPGQVGVYHSALSLGERYDTWRRGRDGIFNIIVGPRSALAVPLSRLGLILVDECHEDSYYQTNDRPYFSAVRAAADYAKILNAQLVLGSATPTTAQMFKAERSGWRILRLRERATGVEPPRILPVDMREELKSGNSEIFSRVLLRELDNSLQAGKQAILFLNRRGTAAYTFCHHCGHSFQCPNCDIPYTWHAARNRLECHYCGSTLPLPERCPECGSPEIHSFGAGVEQVEQLVTGKFPAARVLRLDADTTSGAGSHESLLSRFAAHQADILVGTQMVARGLDFPEVRLVGILLADVGANFHDYRVDEHSYQMLTQVAGRAGRGLEQGLAILQTFQPERYSIRAALRGDYESFYHADLDYRRLLGYPPFSRMVRLEIRDADAALAEEHAEALVRQIRARLRPGLRLIGPAPCYFPRLRGAYRWHLILRGANPLEPLRGLSLTGVRIEVDPPSLL